MQPKFSGEENKIWQWNSCEHKTHSNATCFFTAQYSC